MMSARRLPLALLAGLAISLAFSPGAQGDLATLEADLNLSGAAYEINADDQGWLWISDLAAGQVWGVEPSSGHYSVYAVSGSPSDARHAGGWLWWADGASNVLGRVSTRNGTVTRWAVPGADRFYGTAVDAGGRLWATDADSAQVYRLDADQAELCTFALPDDGMSFHILRDGGYLWLGDWINGRLLRLEVNSNRLDWWSLPEGSSPLGLAIDDQGNLWYADEIQVVLARLSPSANRLASYALPQGTLPLMLTVQAGEVWYTEQDLATIGRLDPQTAAPTVYVPETGGTTLAPTCAPITPEGSGSMAVTTGKLAWNPATYRTLVEGNGWQIVKLPAEASPWGIAGTTGVWFVDTGRQVLGQILAGGMVTGYKVYLPVVLH
jgi:streptogramin lyase